ncbi:hypothetical protein QJS10_CPB11g00979 [Acorus calamus]|uniref:Uncharacterized protein n=1 Tax=Acorus calamus TaxID=4465 RepID=A0AAV9DVW0_ACOCL|nr:hypothetical protein QJS10_CPB11g00979 [Acorus calamus]
MDVVSRRLQGWKGRMLSMAGRSILIQSVINALPQHFMLSAAMPLSAVKDVEQAGRSFLWNGADLLPKIHLISWEAMTRAKAHGGLGLRKLSAMREAMLGVIAFKYLINSSDISSYFALKYKWNGNPWELGNFRKASPVWKALSQGMTIIRPFIRKLPGNLSDIDVLRDPWLLSIPFSRTPTMINMEWATLDYKLSQVVENSHWRTDILKLILPDYWVEFIINTHPPKCNSSGETSWCGDSSTSVSPRVQDVYEVCHPPIQLMHNNSWQFIWALPIFPKLDAPGPLQIQDILEEIHERKRGTNCLQVGRMPLIMQSNM